MWHKINRSSHKTALQRIANGNALLGMSVLMAFVAGCDGGIAQYEVTGQLTFEGEPVPQGRIIFTPRTGPDGYGAQGVARVDAGKIISHDEKRMIGGKYQIQIIGFDGIPYQDGSGATIPYGRPLFLPLRTELELPTQDSSLLVAISGTQGKYEVNAEVVSE